MIIEESPFVKVVKEIEDFEPVSAYGKYLDSLSDVVNATITSADTPRSQFIALMTLDLNMDEIKPYLDSLLINHRNTAKAVNTKRIMTAISLFIPSIIDDDIL